MENWTIAFFRPHKGGTFQHMTLGRGNWTVNAESAVRKVKRYYPNAQDIHLTYYRRNYKGKPYDAQRVVI